LTPDEKLQLGRFDLCLDVTDVKKSAEFYKKLGLIEVEGNIEENWVVLSQGNLRLALYQGHIKEITLNFRGGNVQSITNDLKAKGIEFEKDVKIAEDGSVSAEIRDPDGYSIFFDTHPSEKDILKTLKVKF
jgi:catechol 2,3-dioxygenase-like lactoylglutathione lyase family enzyme